MKANRRIRHLSSLSILLVALTVVAVITFFGLIAAYRMGGLGQGELQVAGSIATAVGFVFAAAGIFVGAAAIQQGYRGNDVRIADARLWLRKRHQIVAEIEYAMFASTTLLDNLAPLNPASVSRGDVIRGAVAVIGTFRRLRDSLAGFASERGFLLTHAVMQERFTAMSTSAFNTYVDAYTRSVQYAPTEHLLRIYPWIFGAPGSATSIPLSPQAMLHAYTSVMIELDYLDLRVPVLLQSLEAEDADVSAGASASDQDSGVTMHQSIVKSAKDMYCHLVVMRAFLEVEWALMFPKPVTSHRLENRIRQLLEATDELSFVSIATPRGESFIKDNVAGYRFAHAIAHLNAHSVFEDDFSLDEPVHSVGSGAPARMAGLYSGWEKFSKPEGRAKG